MQWAMAGRTSELDVFEQLVADPASGGLVVFGPAGVGKSRFGDECAMRVEVPVHRVAATRAAASIPLGAFAPFLPAEGLGAGDDYVKLRRAADALLADVPDGVRPVVYVEDAHTLDDASAALVMQLAVAGTVFLLVTIRSGEAVPDAIGDLWKDLLPRIDLRPLDEPSLEALLASMLGGELEASARHALAEASQGNPLTLRELVVGLRETGVLTDQDGLWRLTSPVGPTPRLAELIASRLEQLDEPARRLLDLLALGEPLGVGALVAQGHGDSLAALERAELVRVTRSQRRGDARIAHPLHAEVARELISEAHRVELLRQLAAEATATGARRREDARRIAIWQLESGDDADALVVLDAAADAFLGHDHDEAERLAHAAQLLGAGPFGAILRSRALDQLGRHAEAEDILGALPTADSDIELLAVAAIRSSNLFRGLGRADEAEAVALAAESAMTDPVCRSVIGAQRAIFATFGGRFADAIALSDPLIASDALLDQVLGALPAAMARVYVGDIARAIEIAERGLEAQRVLSSDASLADALLFLPEEAVSATSLVFALVAHGRIVEARAVIEPVQDRAARAGDRHGSAWSAFARSVVENVSGEVAAAVRSARASSVIFGDLNHPGARFALGLLALALGQSGDARAADAALEDLDAEGENSMHIADVDVERARAWARVAHGDLPAAVAILADAADRAADSGQHGIEALVLHELVRVGAAERATGRLAELAASQGLFVRTVSDLAAGIVAKDGDALDGVAAAFAESGALLYAAEAANEAAIAHRASGDARAAAASRRVSAAYAERCEGAKTPMLASGTDVAVLTRREREITTLAATGLSNKEIADTLVVSARTVENHLQRAYEKLGIKSRAELSDALSGAGY